MPRRFCVTRAVPRFCLIAAIGMGTGSLARPAAAGADAFVVGTGTMATAQAGPDGTMHVAWIEKWGQPVYCRVPVGATGCSPRVNLPTGLPPVDGSDPYRLDVVSPSILVDGDTVEVMAAQACGSAPLRTWTSRDDGRSFDPPQPCDDDPWVPAPLMEPGGLIRDGAGRLLNLASTSRGIGPGPARFTSFRAGRPEGPYGGTAVFAGSETQASVVLIRSGEGAASTLVATATLTTDREHPTSVVYSVYRGAADLASSDQLGDAANWDRSIPLATGGQQSYLDSPTAASMASGPAGLFVAYSVHSAALPSANMRIELRRFDVATKRFGPARTLDLLARDNPLLKNVERQQRVNGLQQDASGRLHLLIDTGSYSKYAISDDGGATFRVLGALPDLSFAGALTRFTVGADGNGLAMAFGFNTSPNPDGYGVESTPAIRVTRMEVVPDPPKPTPTPPAPVRPAVAVPVYAGPTRTTTRTGRRGRLTLRTPRRCLLPGQRFAASVTERKRLHKKLKPLRSVRFRVGTTTTADRRAPFRQVLRVSSSARPGRTVTITATTTPFTVAVKASLKICR